VQGRATSSFQSPTAIFALPAEPTSPLPSKSWMRSKLRRGLAEIFHGDGPRVAKASRNERRSNVEVAGVALEASQEPLRVRNARVLRPTRGSLDFERRVVLAGDLLART